MVRQKSIYHVGDSVIAKRRSSLWLHVGKYLRNHTERMSIVRIIASRTGLINTKCSNLMVIMVDVDFSNLVEVV